MLDEFLRDFLCCFMFNCFIPVTGVDVKKKREQIFIHNILISIQYAFVSKSYSRSGYNQLFGINCYNKYIAERCYDVLIIFCGQNQHKK